MIEIVKDTNIDFVGRRKYGFIFSGIVIAIALSLILIKGPNYGIDFMGGALLQIRFSESITTAELRNTLAQIGYGQASIQALGKEKKEYTIRASISDPGEFAKALRNELTENYPQNQQEILREETVEPKIGRELMIKMFWAIALALVLILIYVSLRFDYRFGTAAVIALFHDAIITIGVLVLTQRQFSIIVVGALLTVIGYSINDSIVVSDRIRENMKKMRREPFNVVLNTGVNETLSRTLLTLGTTLLAVLALLIFGGSVIADFAFTLLIGFIVGTYSTIIIVGGIVSVWEEKFPKKKK
ncbi:protein-export membrane protein SecF [candidate division WOR-3 bacterium RBG_13_43_14]|uniref:Protein-export membrane protein SecF n=1 Tax=candidate division WOR-3 bacterium RBG_13_43_14 TaxID=1802590 RepID=A0A1F4UDV0_UNCW3|nr:MAG: protein-export membrane protein SecF [candidate division WOR-3 bacterium RBG_13_43_14]